MLDLFPLTAEVAEDPCAQVLRLQSYAVRVFESPRRVGQGLGAP